MSRKLLRPDNRAIVSDTNCDQREAVTSERLCEKRDLNNVVLQGSQIHVPEQFSVFVQEWYYNVRWSGSLC